MDYAFSFAPAGLDRAAHLRGGDGPSKDATARTFVFWKGKLLTDKDDQPLTVGLDHPALTDCRDAPVFLGLTPEGPRFAADLALWQPVEDAETIGQFVDATRQMHPGFTAAGFAEIRGVMGALDGLVAECVATGRALLSWHATHRFCANCGQPSEIAQSGWQRTCAACATQHFPRTDPVVIMAITRGDKLLLGRGPSWPEGMYSLLAGFVEPGETIEAAVRRETLEEAGIHVGPVAYAASQPWPFPMSLMFGCVGSALDEDITIDPVELADALWVSKTDVMHILSGQHPLIKAPRKGAIAGFLIAAWAADRLSADGPALPLK
jgi:NAD+ diphosphatase